MSETALPGNWGVGTDSRRLFVRSRLQEGAARDTGQLREPRSFERSRS